MSSKINDILVSVIIPFYNRIDLVIRAIFSAINQTHKNIEIILINDGSTDDIYDIEKIVYKYNNIKIISQSNSGKSAARNRGIMNCKGEYVVFLDSDDEMLPGLIEVSLNMMTKDGFKAAHCSYFRVNNDTKETEIIHSGKFSGNLYPQIICHCPISSSGFIVKRDLLDNDLFPVDISLGEDTVAKILISRKTKILGIDIPLCRIFAHTDYNQIYYQIHGMINTLYHILNKENYFSIEKEINEVIINLCQLIYPKLIKIDNIQKYSYKNINKLLNKSFILYGAGKVGKCYYRQTSMYQDINLKYWVDKDASSISFEYATVFSPDEVNLFEADYILIAILDEAKASNVIDYLIKRGVDKNKILWEEPEILQ